MQKAQASGRKPPTTEETQTLKIKKAWEIALGPAKQLPMQAIMGYMSGNSLQIFSIMMVFMLWVYFLKLKFLVLTINQVQRPHSSHLTDQRRLRQIR
jgi:hypothetical protein